MDLLGTIIGVFCLLGMFLGFLPFLGWLNWFVVPMAIFGLIIGSITKTTNGKTMCILVIIFGILRLILGGGIF